MDVHTDIHPHVVNLERGTRVAAGLFNNVGIWVGMVCLCAPAWATAVPDFDMRTVKAVPVQDIKARAMLIRWDVSKPAADCPQQDNTEVLNLPEQGCVWRQLGLKTCRIISADKTTHSVMGHLIRFCFEGRP